MLQKIENKIVAILQNEMACFSVFAKHENKKNIITSVLLSEPGKGRIPQIKPVADFGADKIAESIQKYCEGKKVSFGFLSLDLSWCTRFQRAVLESARKIERGTTVSYSELAVKAGYPKAVRAVASVMRNNRFPIIIPCHRVVAKDGYIGGYMGAKSGWPIELKRKLLVLEGVTVGLTGNRIVVKQ